MKDYKTIATVSEDELKNIEEYDLTPVDILEIRLDLITEEFLKTSLSAKLAELSKPFLFTYRLPEDSSLAPRSNLNSQDLLNIFMKFDSPDNFVDIDLKNPNLFFPDYKKYKYTKIYSLHNFSGSFSLKEMEEAITKTNDLKGIYKFAVLPKSMEEGILFLESVKNLSKSFTLIGIWMGELGQFTRIFGDLFGSSFTYGTLGEPKAPGQMQIDYISKLRLIPQV